jgi:hypothetical protein
MPTKNFKFPVKSHTRVEVESSLTSSDSWTSGFLVVDTVGFLVVVESSLTPSETTARLTIKVGDDCFTQYLSNDLTKVALIKQKNITNSPFQEIENIN